MSDAVQDLVFLGKRLKGIMELADVLTTREALDNQVKELKGSLEDVKTNIETKKQEFNKIASKQQDLTNTLSTKEQQAQSTYDNILKEASEKASKIIKEANDEVLSILKEGEDKAKSIDTEIEDKNNSLTLINKDILSSTDKLSNIKNEIDKLRSKF